MRHTVVISDIHLSEVDRGSGLWMRYRQRPFLPDGEIAAMLGALLQRIAAGDELTLVLNGDIFDFDAPRVVGGESVFHDLPRAAEHAVPALAAILADHPIFVGAIAHVLAEGHRVVVLSGNHDVVLTLPEVAAHLVARLTDAAIGPAASPRARADLAARITVRPWFHRTDDGIVIEHGHQYDRYCATRSPMGPGADRAGLIPPTFGSLATRHLAARFGYFNLHDDRTFMRSPWGYAAHWGRRYLFSRRSPLGIWIVGVTRVIREIRRHRRPRLTGRAERLRRREGIVAAAYQTGAPPRAVARHARLFAEPLGERILAVLRELWVDRIAIVLAAILLGALAPLLLRHPAGYAGCFAPLLFIAYERLAPRKPLDQNWRRSGHVGARIAAIHRARAVVLGHTHAPDGRWDGDVFIGNSGSWAAVVPAPRAPATTRRHVIWLRSDPGADLTGGLYAWQDGRFIPDGAREMNPPRDPREIAFAPQPSSAPAACPEPTPQTTG